MLLSRLFLGTRAGGLALISAILCLSSASPILPVDNEIPEKSFSGAKSTLRQVTVVMRHGERAPQDTYPNDPYIKNPMKPYGWGQLTNVGRINQYKQGDFLRNRYDDFLGSTYSPHVFYLQCTAVDRTKMSAQLEAAALWKPPEEQVFKSDLKWQPVTLFYQPHNEDTLMLIWDTCPRYTQLRREIMDLPEVRKIQDDNADLYADLTNLTGMPIKGPEDVASLYATLKAENDMNLTLPEWTAGYFPDKLIPLTLYHFKLNTYNDDLRRLQGGPFLKKIVEHMIAKKEGHLQPESRKMYMYVGHDSTVVTLLDVMHIWYDQMPTYNVMTMIELHEDDFGWNVQVFLRNTTSHDPYPLTIPGCTTACPLDKFVQILKPMIADNWEQACKAHGDYTPPPPPTP